MSVNIAENEDKIIINDDVTAPYPELELEDLKEISGNRGVLNDIKNKTKIAHTTVYRILETKKGKLSTIRKLQDYVTAYKEATA